MGKTCIENLFYLNFPIRCASIASFQSTTKYQSDYTFQIILEHSLW